MKTTRGKTAAAVVELDERIDRAVTIQVELEKINTELKAEKAAIKTLMEDAELRRQATARGNEALLIEEQRFSWDTEKLHEVLDRKQFDELCPRSPKGLALRQVYEQACAEGDTAISKELRSCAKVSSAERLELRQAGAEK